MVFGCCLYSPLGVYVNESYQYCSYSHFVNLICFGIKFASHLMSQKIQEIQSLANPNIHSSINQSSINSPSPNKEIDYAGGKNPANNTV